MSLKQINQIQPSQTVDNGSGPQKGGGAKLFNKKCDEGLFLGFLIISTGIVLVPANLVLWQQFVVHFATGISQLFWIVPGYS